MNKKYDVLCIGLQVIDMVVSPIPHNVLELGTSRADIEMHLGGDALNQAVTVSSLGAKTALMGAVGNDRLGEILLSQLEKMPIHVEDKTIDTKTGISIVLVDTEHERHIVYQTDNNEEFSYNEINEEIIKESKIVSIGGFMALKNLDEDGIPKILRLAKEHDAITVMDCRVLRPSYNMDKIKEALSLTDYFLPSEEEASWLTGEKKDYVKMAETLHEMGAKNCIVKIGEKGCYVSAEGIKKVVPAFPCNCVDTTGAGDTFAGAFLYAKSKGWDTETCALFGNAAASIGVEHIGANGAIKNVEQVMERMKLH